MKDKIFLCMNYFCVCVPFHFNLRAKEKNVKFHQSVPSVCCALPRGTQPRSSPLPLCSQGTRRQCRRRGRHPKLHRSRWRQQPHSHWRHQPHSHWRQAAPQLNAALSDGGAKRDHCLFKRDDIAKAYREQLQGKYNVLPEFERWFERFISVLWKVLNKNVKRDIPTQKEFREQVIGANGAASDFCENIVFAVDVTHENVVEESVPPAATPEDAMGHMGRKVKAAVS